EDGGGGRGLAGPGDAPHPEPAVGAAVDIEHGPGRGPARAERVAGGRNADDQRVDRDGGVVLAGDVVERGDAGAVVRDPEGATGAFGDAPRIHQVRVGDGGDPGQVGHEVGLQDVAGQQAAIFEGFQAGADAGPGGWATSCQEGHVRPPKRITERTSGGTGVSEWAGPYWPEDYCERGRVPMKKFGGG